MCSSPPPDPRGPETATGLGSAAADTRAAGYEEQASAAPEAGTVHEVTAESYRERGAGSAGEGFAHGAVAADIDSAGGESGREMGVEIGEADREAERALVARAVAGDRTAVTDIVRLLQDPVYRLALRMTGRPADAEDATQEILLRAVGHLGGFRGEARLTTWAYRIGVNYLLNLARQSAQESARTTFGEFGEDLKDGLAEADHLGPEATLLARETRLNCTQAMLQCLARDERVAYVLSTVFEVSSQEAAWIVDATPAAYRKRLERARNRLGNFMNASCGLVNPQAACRCSRRVARAVELGRVDARRPVLAGHPVTPGGRTVAEAERQMVRLHDAAAVIGAHPDYAAPQAKLDVIAGLLHSGRFPLLD